MQLPTFEAFLPDLPLISALLIMGAFLYAGARISAREFHRLESRIDSLEGMIAPATIAAEKTGQSLAQLEKIIMAEGETGNSETLNQLATLGNQVQTLRDGLETMTNEQSMTQAIDLARTGATVKDICKSTHVSRAEAEALVRFHSGRDSDPTRKPLAV